MSTLEDIKARLAKAVDMGEWSAKHPTPGGSWIAVEKPSGFTNVTAVVASKIDHDDAEFIANAPTDMARLIAALEAALATPSSGFDDQFAKGFNAAVNHIRATINEALEES